MNLLKNKPDFLKLPARNSKPRQTGLTILIDNGYSLNYYKDVITSFADYIDYIKFGWCTAYITENLYEKIAFAKEYQIELFLGGTFFEKALQQNQLTAYINYIKKLKLTTLEISNGTINLSNKDKLNYIASLALDFQIFSEVGYKDPGRTDELSTAQWIECIQLELKHGAKKVILEARESGTAGICDANGNIKNELIHAFLNAGIDTSQLIYEAPQKQQQVFLIKELGANINLANIAFTDIVSLETLRLGLRSDTMGGI